jgi:integrase/recombinase XerD
MRKHNAENERMKREYLRWLKNARGRSEPTLDIAAAAIDRFEAHAGFRDFKGFRREQAISFKEHLGAERHPTSGKPLAKATLYGTLKGVQAFFEWLSREPGYRSHVHMSDAAYFRLTDNDARIATARRDRPAPSLEQVQHVIASMPAGTVVERRDRAVVALILLTGARDMAVASLRIKRLDLSRRELVQDARDVKTKRAKTFTTWFFPVGEEAVEAVAAWVAELKGELRFGPDDPLLPATKLALDAAGLFTPVGVERRPWTTAAPIRELFRKAFEGAGLPYYGPHSIRRTLVTLAYDLNLGPRDMKAWSQNLGHESVLTTLGSYGTLSQNEQADIMRRLVSQRPDEPGGAYDPRALLRLALAQMDTLRG